MNEHLRSARLKKGMSQQEVADAAHVSLRAYQRWESGEAAPNFGSRRLLRETFACGDEALGFYGGPQPIVFVSHELDELATLLEQRSNIMVFDEAKRQTLRKLLTLAGTTVGVEILTQAEPWAQLAASSKTALPTGETMASFERLLGEVWELLDHGESAVAEQTLATFLPRLLQLAPHQTEAARLSAQGLRLQSVLAHHGLRLQEKMRLCEQAVEYAKLAGEGNVLLLSLNELAVGYEYGEQPEKWLVTCQEALMYIDQASSPLIQSRTYGHLAAALAKAGRGREARFYLDMAEERFPLQPEQDSGYSQGVLIYRRGLVHLYLGDYGQAWTVFDRINSPDVAMPERIRLEIRNQQGRAAISLQDLDQYSACLEESLSGAIALQSQKRYDEALTIFRQQVPQSWRKEAPIRRLVEQFHLA